MGSLELKKFDMRNISEDKVVVFIGKRETGKSILVKDLLYYHQDIPVGTVISGTEGANSFYSKWYLAYLYIMNIEKTLFLII